MQVADAIVDVLEAVTFDLPVKCERSWGDLNEPLPELKYAKIDVVPFMPAADMDTDGRLDYSHTVDILIRRKFDVNEIDVTSGLPPRDQVDEMVLLLQKVWETLIPCAPTQTGRLTLDGGLEAVWDPQMSRIMQFNMRPMLKKIRQYTGLIRLGYKVSKVLG